MESRTKASVENYIVRIYRRINTSAPRIVGVVEDSARGSTVAFHSFAELRIILGGGMPQRRRRAEKRRRPKV